MKHPFTRKGISVVISIAIVASIGATYFTCPESRTDAYSYFMNALASFFLWSFLWLGNDYLMYLLDLKFSWFESPLRRFWLSLLTTIGYSVTIVVIIVATWMYIFNFYPGDFGTNILVSLIITFLITLFLQGRYFLINWKKSAVDAERWQKENIKAQYQNLQSQVNPHFLFNSLNALTNLVYNDPDKAAKFIKQLSEVYRYVLDAKGKELVSLQEELDFLKSYIFLQQIRFGDKLRVKIELDKQNTLVPPMVLQMLCENSIKHNVVSVDDPLSIWIYAKDELIVVTNNLQRKKLVLEESTGIGLENIKRRYEFLSTEKLEIVEDGISFTVKLPFIKAD